MRKLSLAGAGLAFAALLAGCPTETRTGTKTVPHDVDGEVQKTSDDVAKAQERSDQGSRTMGTEEKQRENKAEEKKKQP